LSDRLPLAPPPGARLPVPASPAALAARPLTGVLLAIVAYFLFASCDAITKVLTTRYPVFQIIPLQVLFALLPVVAVLVWRGRSSDQRPVHPRLVAARGLLAGIGSIGGYYAFATLPLADVYAISFCIPILVTLLSIPVLGERVGAHRWSAVLVGFAGILVMIQPGSTALSLGHAGAFLGACCGAVITLILRKIAGREHAPSLVLALILGVLLVNAPLGAFVARLPSLADLGLFAASGLLMGIAQFVMLRAFARAPAASVAPMQYTMMVWALLYGTLVFGDEPRAAVLVGAAIVAASSLYILHRERRARG
jgi:drug/metabolite transporter (DMT)-like permease